LDCGPTVLAQKTIIPPENIIYMNYLALGAQIAFFMIGGILAGIGLGYLADKYWGFYPWGIIVGVILGVVVGAAGVIHVINQDSKE
jgi:F0F1-type ATP synthase assembly protein I